MRILLVTHVIFPFQSPRSFRSTELAIELASKGHYVTIYTNKGCFDYSEFENKNNLRVKAFKKLNFIKKKTSGDEKHSFISKVLRELFRRLLFYPNIEFLYNIPKSLKKENNYDLLISIAAPHSIHWGCEKAMRKNQTLAKKWIADCGDPFMGNEHEKPPFYFEVLERRFCKKADFITVPIEDAKKAYYSDYINKLVVIPQGFNFTNINISEKPINNNIPTFAFSGMVYKSIRDPTVFLEYLVKLNMSFKFIVYTKDVSIFPNYIKLLGSKIEIRPYITRDKLLLELSKMDFLINFENKSVVQSPSKLIDYALSKRPILNINCTTLNEIKFIEFISGNYSSQDSIEIDKYNIETVAQQFINLVE